MPVRIVDAPLVSGDPDFKTPASDAWVRIEWLGERSPAPDYNRQREEL